jgi:hypothetical protein
MKWRVIIRMSFTYDRGSRLRYRVEKSLAECGIRLIKTTGTWESHAVSAQEAAKMFQEVFALLSGLAESGQHGRGRLNHLWIYIDRAPSA